MSSYFNKTAASIAATAAGNNLTAIAEIYKGHEELSPKSMYSGFVPNLVFNSIAMAIFFAYSLWFFLMYIVYKNNYYSICMFLYLAGQGVGYLGRTLSSADISGLSLNNRNYFLIQFTCLTLSPNFFNAAIYSQYGKLLFSYATTREKVAKLNVFGQRAQPTLLSAGGGVEGSAVNAPTLTMLHLGNHIFVAGLAVQVASMSLFLIIYTKLVYNIFIKQRIEYLNQHSSTQIATTKTFFTPWKWYSIYKSCKFEDIDPIMCNVDTSDYGSIRQWIFNTYPIGIFFAFAFAVIRCIYRLVELADGGFMGFLIKHEHYLVALDFSPLSISGFIMCLYAEGLVFGRRGLLEISIIKKCAYRGLSSWKEFKIECRCLFGMKVDNERLNKQFENMNKEEFRHDNYSIDMMDYSNNGYNQYSHAEPYNTQYLKKTAFFKRTLAQKINSSWW
ncbi:hypothetical protein ACO0R3_003191 [Hanseniaspora guilliermondii]